MKQFLLTSIFLLSTFSLWSQQRNVILIMADDFNHWIEPIGYYTDVQTPNINALAAKGVLFRDASSASPVCNPSRNAMLAGLRPSTTDISRNGDGYIRAKEGYEDIITLNQHFTNNGYYTYAGGKIYHPGKMGATETDPSHWSDLTTQGTGSPGGPFYSFESTANSSYKWNAGEFDLNTANDTKLANHFADKITNYNQEEPFFMACGFFRPHLAWRAHKQFFDLYDLDSIKIPQGYLPNDAADINGYTGANDIFQSLTEPPIRWKEAIRAYMACMTYADYNVGIVLDALENSPHSENTIVVFVGDHGWHLGEKDRFSKHAVFDQASRTTMIIYDPSATGNGQISRKVVSMQDIYPTLVALTGLPICDHVQGNSLVPLLQNPNDESWDKPIFMTYAGTTIIKTNEFRLVDAGNNSQLYNIQDDPFEFTNLYGNPGYTGVYNDLRGQIAVMKSEGATIRATVMNDEVNCQVVSNKEVLKSKVAKLQVYPNPSTDSITIDGLLPKEMVSIYNLSGQRLISQVQQAQINIQDLPKGVYLIQTDRQRFTHFVKK